MKLLSSIISICLFSLLVPQLSYARDCEKESHNMAEVRDCISQQNDTDVKNVYERLDAKLKSQNPEASLLLAKSQKDWLKFASSSCEVYVRLRTDGPMANDFRSQCWSSFTEARIRVLQSYERDLGKQF